jgi:hypothetical protein
VGSHLPQPAQPDGSRLTSPHPKMILATYKSVAHQVSRYTPFWNLTAIIAVQPAPRPYRHWPAPTQPLTFDNFRS